MPGTPGTPAFFRGIRYWEVVRNPASPEESWSNDKSLVTRTIDVNWTDKPTYISESLGYSTVKFAADNTTRYINRVVPQADPEYQLLYCTAISNARGMAPTGQNTQQNAAAYTRARLSVTFESLTYKILRDDEVFGSNALPDESTLKRYITRSYHPAAQFIASQPGLLRWVDANKTPIPYGVPRIVPFVEVAYTWHLVPIIPFVNIDKCLGGVNNATFDINNPMVAGGYTAETLLLVAVDIEPVKQANVVTQQLYGGASLENLVYNIHYRFKYLPNRDLSVAGNPERGHNWFLHSVAKVMNYYQVTDDGTVTGNPPYRKVDMTLLFKP